MPSLFAPEATGCPRRHDQFVLLFRGCVKGLLLFGNRMLRQFFLYSLYTLDQQFHLALGISFLIGMRYFNDILNFVGI